MQIMTLNLKIIEDRSIFVSSFFVVDDNFFNNHKCKLVTIIVDLDFLDVENQAALLKQPLLMIIGDISDTRYMTDDKKVVYIEVANHIETYWKPEFVGQEVSEVIKFFSALYIIVL
ncbi:hypothetical protein [Ligilactobacillus salivarius]|uniref:hypothetical protein n=2 Tax=Ligilactobacillus salivarius TaxID=1624 RepID=UPI0024B9DB2E|nr:hypothetical protein [Ligilactobacillus salivarius]WHS09398.1 hypothetical protein O2U04_06140 [Ligilactobacillus salivarius]WNB34035.1 hypothetical protein O2U09_09085 [Ligilactobacillus salivarius]